MTTDARTIHNPVTGERVTFVQTSQETAGARTVAEVHVLPGGGVFAHRHTDHDERIEVLDGEIELDAAGVTRRIGAGEHADIPRGIVHGWRNPAAEQSLTFRGTMTPGHPGFERSLRVAFGLGRDGELRANGMPRRFGDAALLAHWDPSLFAGPMRLLAPVMRWVAGRAFARRRAQELLGRYAATS